MRLLKLIDTKVFIYKYLTLQFKFFLNTQLDASSLFFKYIIIEKSDPSLFPIPIKNVIYD